MKKKLLCASALVMFLAQGLFALTGLEIMQKNDQKKKPNSSKAEVVMTIERQGGRTEEKEFTVLSKKESETKGKALIQFTKPTQMKFLTHSGKGEAAQQWIKQESGSVKKIASSDKGKEFVHSHFANEDMAKSYLDDNNYKYLGDEKVNNDDCYKVEAVKKDNDSSYDKTVMYLRKTDYTIVKIDFYQKGKLLKYLINTDLKEVEGFITVYTATMYMADSKEKTTVKLKEIKYNVSVPASKLQSSGL